MADTIWSSTDTPRTTHPVRGQDIILARLDAKLYWTNHRGWAMNNERSFDLEDGSAGYSPVLAFIKYSPDNAGNFDASIL